MSMLRKVVRQRGVLIGCQICGETDLPLRICDAGRLCPRCAARVFAPDTGISLGQDKQSIAGKGTRRK